MCKGFVKWIAKEKACAANWLVILCKILRKKYEISKVFKNRYCVRGAYHHIKHQLNTFYICPYRQKKLCRKTEKLS